MSKTKVSVKDGRLSVFASDARTPSVSAWGLDQISSGVFEIAAAENEGHALVFKPAGKKTAETVAVYNAPKQAQAALRAVFAALETRRKSGFLSGIGGIVKVGAVLVVSIIVLMWLLSGMIGSMVVPDVTDDGQIVEVPDADSELPVGEPFPVEDFVRKTQSGQ